MLLKSDLTVHTTRSSSDLLLSIETWGRLPHRRIKNGRQNRAGRTLWDRGDAETVGHGICRLVRELARYSAESFGHNRPSYRIDGQISDRKSHPFLANRWLPSRIRRKEVHR